MSINELIIGELDTDGSIKRDVFSCAVQLHFFDRQVPTQRGDVMRTVAGTKYFYRVSAPFWRHITEEQIAELDGLAKPSAAPKKKDEDK